MGPKILFCTSTNPVFRGACENVGECRKVSIVQQFTIPLNVFSVVFSNVFADKLTDVGL